MSDEFDLVTGATGFIGQSLARRLIGSGRRVRLLCRRGSEGKLGGLAGAGVGVGGLEGAGVGVGGLEGAEIALGDLRDAPSLAAAARGARRVFHCAGHVSDWGTAELFREINVEGTRRLLEAAKAGGVGRFIHLSSIAAFGTPSPEYFDDRTEYGKGRDGYSLTKAEGDRLALSFQGLPVTVLRPAVVYGLGGTWFEEPLRMIERGKMFLLGGGLGTCHPCYVENLVDAILLAAEHRGAVGRGYIVGDGEAISFREFFGAVAAVAGRGPVARSIPLPAARAIAVVCELGAKVTRSRSRPLLTHAAIDMVTTRSRMSIAAIGAELGFKPRWSFREAMDEIARGYRARLVR